MIQSISIADVATFPSEAEELGGLSKFNFIFGSNGTGKTTISRVIADESAFPACRLTWERGTKLQPLVYNRDFVEKNFRHSAELKGVFTLGEENIDILDEIAAERTKLDGLTGKIESLNHQLAGEDGSGGKKGELVKLESALRVKIWNQKQKHDPRFQGAFEGFRGSAEKFKKKILQEWENNTAVLESLEDLQSKAASIFGPTPAIENAISAIDASMLLAYESDPILKKRLFGKQEVDIAGMIKKLGNSDWVKTGRAFYDINDGVCPFCQQTTADTFAQSLTEYFDEAFELEINAIAGLVSAYKSCSAEIQQQIASVIGAPPSFLDLEKFQEENELLVSKSTINIQKLETKLKEPSQSIELESVNSAVSSIVALIAKTNKKISGHNRMVSNLSSEQRELKAQVWKYLLEVELKSDLNEYTTARARLDNAITSMEARALTFEEERAKCTAKIQGLEKLTASIQPTIDEINSLLSSFGFQGFSLTKAGDGRSYRLVREDGTDAKETLSEGEMAFVTFLYFYHLLKGSDSESGLTTNRIVVFDDPVSSLDSDILFVVSTLIKGLFDEVREGSGYIKQVFVLTHNVYFFKEVTFSNRRGNEVMNEETFWVVRRHDSLSKLKNYGSNPIKTSYELLWTEVRDPDRSNLTIQNTLRRILENYFKILGGFDPDDICGRFSGKEKLICKSLFSWTHEGSHSAHEDFYHSIGDTMVETYLKVFKAVFYKTDHSAHYDMMMKKR